MSELRRKRQAERNPQPRDYSPWFRKLGIAGIILVTILVVYYFGVYRQSHKYDAFAKCLGEKQLKMYGAYWCPHCQDQKEKFDASFAYVPYVECGIKGNPRGGETQECKDAGIKQFPTWVFPDGKRDAAVLSLNDLSQRTGCSLP